jgi:hypothetical protein
MDRDGILDTLKNKYNGWIYFVGIPFNDEITIKENYFCLKKNIISPQATLALRHTRPAQAKLARWYAGTSGTQKAHA